MSPRLTVQASTIIVLLLAFADVRWPEFGFGLTTAATAQDARPIGRFDRAIDNISVARTTGSTVIRPERLMDALQAKLRLTGLRSASRTVSRQSG